MQTATSFSAVVLEFIYLKQTEKSHNNQKPFFQFYNDYLFFSGHVNYSVLPVFHTIWQTHGHRRPQSETIFICNLSTEKDQQVLRIQEYVILHFQESFNFVELKSSALTQLSYSASNAEYLFHCLRMIKIKYYTCI